MKSELLRETEINKKLLKRKNILKNTHQQSVTEFNAAKERITVLDFAITTLQSENQSLQQSNRHLSEQISSLSDSKQFQLLLKDL